VGDLAFQRKCFDRMEQMIRRQGRTVLLVSHNLRQVTRISSRTLMLDHGGVVADGDPSRICDLLYAESDRRAQQRAGASGVSALTGRVSSSGVELLDVALLDSEGKATDRITYNSAATLSVTFRAARQLKDPIFAFGLDTTDLLHIAAERSEGRLEPRTLVPGTYTVSFRMKTFPLMPGVYSLRMSVTEGDLLHECFYGDRLITFYVDYPDADRPSYQGECFIRLTGSWRVIGELGHDGVSTESIHCT
jgi:hypothetical protein